MDTRSCTYFYKNRNKFSNETGAACRSPPHDAHSRLLCSEFYERMKRISRANEFYTFIFVIHGARKLNRFCLFYVHVCMHILHFTYIYFFFVIHGANKHNCTVFLYIAYLHLHINGATKQKQILLYFMYMSMHNLYFTHTYIYIYIVFYLYFYFCYSWCKQTNFIFLYFMHMHAYLIFNIFLGYYCPMFFFLNYSNINF